jgi:hypothetical protein
MAWVSAASKDDGFFGGHSRIGGIGSAVGEGEARDGQNEKDSE